MFKKSYSFLFFLTISLFFNLAIYGQTPPSTEAGPTEDSIKKKEEVGQLFKKPKPKIEEARFLWKDVSYGLRDMDLHSVACHPQNPEVVYLGSSSAVFKTVDKGRHWREVLSVGGTEEEVNFITLDPKASEVVYAATQNGLYRTIDSGRRWGEILQGVSRDERKVQSLAIDSSDTKRIYAGTSHGLFLTNDGGKTWKKASGRVADLWVTFVILHPSKKNVLYVATKEGVFKTIDGGRAWKKVFATAYEEEEEVEESEEEEEESEEVQCIAVDPLNPQRVYLGARNGFFVTNNGGETWERGIKVGLTNTNIRCIVVSSKDAVLYAATRKGVFKFSKARDMWQELYAGMTTRDIRFIAFNSIKNILWAATNRGVYKGERR